MKNKKKIIIISIIIIICIALLITYFINKDKAKEINISNEDVTETNVDTSAIELEEETNGNITNTKIVKTGDSSDLTQSDKKGLNSAVIVNAISEITIEDTEIETSGKGSSGIVSTGGRAVVNISDTNITTTNDRSKGILVSNSGNIYADKLNITTSGYKSSAVATDFGGGNIKLSNCTIETNGEDSAGIYSTGHIEVTNSTITTNQTEGAAIDGSGEIVLKNVNITANGKRGVLIYYTGPKISQSTIGRFTMTGGSLLTKSGPAFYVTNTTAEINLEEVSLTTESKIFLKASIDEYGELGQENAVETSTGGTVTVNATKQQIKGDIQVDSKSTVELNLEAGSTFTGAINKENTGKEIKVTLDSTSVWNLTGDCYITTLENNGGTINTNGYKITYIDPVEEDDNRINSNYKK